MKSRVPKGYGGNMNDMVKRAQDMQNEMQKAQEELEQMEFSTTVGGGAIEVTVTGKKEIKSLNIKPEVVDADDVEMLQDLIISAVNEAMRLAEEKSDEDIQRITGGMSVPGLF